jgi:hypothetical protein
VQVATLPQLSTARQVRITMRSKRSVGQVVGEYIVSDQVTTGLASQVLWTKGQPLTEGSVHKLPQKPLPRGGQMSVKLL